MVTARFAPSVGGVERHVAELSRRLAAMGCQIEILTTDLTGTLPRWESVEGVQVRRVRAWPRGRDYHVAPAVYSTIRSAAKRWDLVHVQSYHTFVAPLAMLAAYRARLPFVLTFHGGGHASRLRRALRPAQRTFLAPLLRRAAALVAVANFEVEFYTDVLGLGRERFAVISNGVDKPADPAPATPAAGALIASVGRLEAYKGHQRILAALPDILSSRSDARLWIAGEGPYESALRRQATDLGVADKVEIRPIPASDRRQMTNELGKAALVVLLSEFETQPLAVLEAAALGRPALVADTSGLRELAERGLAVSVPLESSPAEIAAAVLDQLAAPLQPQSQRLPTWDDCASSHLRLYERVLANCQMCSR